MLGAPEVGKTHLTNQFMSSSDVGTFNQLTGKCQCQLYFFRTIQSQIEFVMSVRFGETSRESLCRQGSLLLRDKLRLLEYNLLHPSIFPLFFAFAVSRLFRILAQDVERCASRVYSQELGGWPKHR